MKQRHERKNAKYGKKEVGKREERRKKRSRGSSEGRRDGRRYKGAEPETNLELVKSRAVARLKWLPGYV